VGNRREGKKRGRIGRSETDVQMHALNELPTSLLSLFQHNRASSVVSEKDGRYVVGFVSEMIQRRKIEDEETMR
jgi:hypothetical protein